MIKTTTIRNLNPFNIKQQQAWKNWKKKHTHNNNPKAKSRTRTWTTTWRSLWDPRLCSGRVDQKSLPFPLHCPWKNNNVNFLPFTIYTQTFIVICLTLIIWGGGASWAIRCKICRKVLFSQYIVTALRKQISLTNRRTYWIVLKYQHFLTLIMIVIIKIDRR